MQTPRWETGMGIRIVSSKGFRLRLTGILCGRGGGAGKIGWVWYRSAALRKISLENEYNKLGVQWALERWTAKQGICAANSVCLITEQKCCITVYVLPKPAVKCCVIANKCWISTLRKYPSLVILFQESGGLKFQNRLFMILCVQKARRDGGGWKD